VVSVGPYRFQRDLPRASKSCAVRAVTFHQCKNLQIGRALPSRFEEQIARSPVLPDMTVAPLSAKQVPETMPVHHILFTSDHQRAPEISGR